MQKSHYGISGVSASQSSQKGVITKEKRKQGRCGLPVPSLDYVREVTEEG